MKYKRMPIEVESPEQMGYATIACNLAESSVTDALFKNLNINVNDLVLCYGDHLGKPELRALIASEAQTLNAQDVLLTAGAASALFIVATSLLSSEDHLIVMRPNYATNIETPRAIGCEISFIDLQFQEQFAINLDQLVAAIKPNTKLISITCPHNPTGTMLTLKQLHQLIDLAKAHNCYLLVDETYRDLSLNEKLPIAASIADHVISVSSVSKAYGLPGIRLGWLITKNFNLQELFLAAKEQIFLCNSVLDEEVAYQFLMNKEVFFGPIKKHIKTNFSILKKWMNNHLYLEWIEPSGGVVCFPRIKPQIKVDVELFYKILFEEYKTVVGPGHWFEIDKRYMRIGFGWPSAVEFEEGLENIDNALKKAQNKGN